MKYKTLEIGKYYITRRGDFAVHVIGGDEKHGYKMRATVANPITYLGVINIFSREVPNNGNWIEISEEVFGLASSLHTFGHGIRHVPFLGAGPELEYMPSPYKLPY